MTLPLLILLLAFLRQHSPRQIQPNRRQHRIAKRIIDHHPNMLPIIPMQTAHNNQAMQQHIRHRKPQHNITLHQFKRFIGFQQRQLVRRFLFISKYESIPRIDNGLYPFFNRRLTPKQPTKKTHHSLLIDHHHRTRFSAIPFVMALYIAILNLKFPLQLSNQTKERLTLHKSKVVLRLQCLIITTD